MASHGKLRLNIVRQACERPASSLFFKREVHQDESNLKSRPGPNCCIECTQWHPFCPQPNPPSAIEACRRSHSRHLSLSYPLQTGLCTWNTAHKPGGVGAFLPYAPIHSPSFTMTRKPQPGWWIYKEWAFEPIVHMSCLASDIRGFLSQTNGLSLSR